MTPTTPADPACAVMRTVEIIGDRWTPLVLRDIAFGISRFDRIQRDLGVSRKVLAQRLEALQAHGVVERTAYQLHPPRYDYALTEKGRDLTMVLAAIMGFGDKWFFAESGPPVLWRHLACGEISEPVACCSNCGEQISVGDAVPLRGPSFDDELNPEIGPAIDTLAALIG